MTIRYLPRVIAVLFVCASAALGDDRNPDAGIRAGEPNLHEHRYGTLATFTYPDPIVLKNLEPIQYFYIRGTGFDVNDVDLETVLVLGKIPPADSAWVRGDWLMTTVSVRRFLGSGGFRPITESFDAGYTVEFDLVGGEHVVVEGEFSLVLIQGDLTFDGIVNLEDLVVLTDYLYRGGPAPELGGDSFIEVLDVNQDGEINEDDLEALEDIIGL